MQVLGGIEEAKEIIANETDQEMREMAREELDACQTRQPELEEQIKLPVSYTHLDVYKRQP